MSECEHDQRFRGLFGAKNGCCACQLEETAAQLRECRELLREICNDHLFYGDEDGKLDARIRKAIGD